MSESTPQDALRDQEAPSYSIPDGFESRFSQLDILKIKGFEGPLDLLLFLIREHKLNILNLPMAQITQQYMEYLRVMEQLNLDIAAEYIAMAAHLIQIKSKMMLPAAPGEEGLDPRKRLVQKLLEYQQVKEATENLVSRRADWENIVLAPEFDLKDFAHIEEEPIRATTIHILNAYRDALSRLIPPPPVVYESQPKTVEQRIAEILDMLHDGSWRTLQGMFFDRATKYELVLTFVALLELTRSSKIAIIQSDLFGEIRIKAS